FRTGQELVDKTGAAYNVLQREADTARPMRQEHERAQGTHDAPRSCMTAVGWLASTAGQEDRKDGIEKIRMRCC
ncbi:MAG: hypothetical protein K2H10_05370, partial [Bacteroidales bacterium]|nr:hypothetical protein [Bacteroidales bacterium]